MTPHSPDIDPFRFQWAEEDLSPEDAESLLEQYSHKDDRKQHILRDSSRPISHSTVYPIKCRRRS